MRSTIIYFDRKLTPLQNTQRILDLRDQLFDRTRVPRHHIHWVVCSSRGGYWTTEP